MTFTSPQITTLHVDINSYFATLLQQENPRLRGRAIGVIKDEGRTCIIAASKEAKTYGIKTGCGAAEARRLCPDLLLIPASFERYLDATKKLAAVFESFTPDTYIYSLDEAFLDISHCQRYLYSNPRLLAKKIQEQIKLTLGEWVTTNVGLGPNRFQAKLASEIAPKGTFLEINQDNLDAYLASVEFDDVCGIGPRLARKLARLGVSHPYQIRFYGEEELAPIFGPFWSRELIKMAYGEEPELLKRLDYPKKEHMQSVGRSITGFRLYQKRAEIKSIIYNLCLEIIDKVRAMGLSGRQVFLSLNGQNHYWSSHRTLKVPLNHASALIDEVRKLYQEWPGNFAIIRFAVRLSLLEPHRQDQILPSWQKSEALQTALDKIHQRFGLFTVHPATIDRSQLIRPEVTGFLGDRQYQLGG